MSAPHALVLGVGPGLGRALALRYASAGYDVTLVARRLESNEPVAAEIAALGRQAWPVVADAADPEQVDAAVCAASAHGPLHLLHHNASMHVGGLLDTDPDMIATAVQVCAISAVVAVQAALPDLTATAGQPLGGLVAWTGGGIALAPRAEYGVLAVGKAALRAAGFALAPELAQRDVRLRMLTVNGFIRPGGRFDPEIIAAAAWDHTVNGAEVERIYTGKP